MDVLLAKANKWKGKAIDKENKLACATNKLNENTKHFEVAKEEEEKLMAKKEGYKYELKDAMHKKEETMWEFEETKHDLCVVTEQVTKSI